MKKILSVLLLLNLAACGKIAATKSPTQTKSGPDSLVGLDRDQIIKTKYDNQIHLFCELRVNSGMAIDPVKEPVDTLRWNIPREFSSERVLSFKVQNKDFVVVIRKGGFLKIEESLVLEVGDQEFLLEYTPVLKMRFEVLAKADYDKGVVEARELTGEASVFENIPSVVYGMVTERPGSSVTSEELRCELKTRARTDYKSQWQRTK